MSKRTNLLYLDWAWNDWSKIGWRWVGCLDKSCTWLDIFAYCGFSISLKRRQQLPIEQTTFITWPKRQPIQKRKSAHGDFHTFLPGQTGRSYSFKPTWTKLTTYAETLTTPRIPIEVWQRIWYLKENWQSRIRKTKILRRLHMDLKRGSMSMRAGFMRFGWVGKAVLMWLGNRSGIYKLWATNLLNASRTRFQTISSMPQGYERVPNTDEVSFTTMLKADTLSLSCHRVLRFDTLADMGEPGLDPRML